MRPSLNNVAAFLIVIVLIMAFVVPVPARAQAPASLAGRILDATGAVLPGVSLTLSLPSGAVIASATADAGGRYAFPGLEPGVYVVTAALGGFSPIRAEVAVQAEPLTLNLTLSPGALTEEVTVIGARLVASEEMLRRVPGSFDEITSDVLAASRVFTTSEALRKVPGVTVRDEEGLGLRPNIGIRGLNPTRSTKVLLLEDGVPTAFAPYGDNASYYHPPIERFDRIEVLKGSSQIAHGPVTLGGVINYITPEAPSRPAAALSLTGGTRGYANLGVSAGGTWARTGLFVQGVRKVADGARDNVHTRLTDVMVKATRAFSATQQVSVKGNYYGEDSLVTYSALRESEYAVDPRQNPFANDAYDGDRVGLSATYRALVWSRMAFTGTAYTSSFGRDWWRQSSNSNQRPNDASDPACGGMANLDTSCGNEGRLRDYRLAGVEARARVSFEAGIAQETDAGVRLHGELQNRRQENGATPRARSGVLVEDNDRTADAVAAFVQHRLIAGAWTVTPGVRVERVAYTRANRLVGVSGRANLTEVIPGIGVSYGPSPDSTVFAGVHRGFAPPRAEDVVNNATGGSVDLDPERSWNYEIGGRARVGRGIRVDGAVYRLDYENQIVPASLAGGVGAALTNGGETLHQGVEVGAEGDWRRLRGSAHDVYVRIALTWLPVAEFMGVRSSSVPGWSGVSVSGNRLPYAPETAGSFTAGYRHQLGLDVQIEAQHVGEQFADDLNTIAGTDDGQRGLIPAYTYWNLAASLRIPGTSGALYLAVKNLADGTYIVDRSRGILPGHPRLVQVGTSWRF